MPSYIEENNSFAKNNFNSLNRSKSLFKSKKSFFISKASVKNIKNLLNSDKIQAHTEPSPRIKKISLQSLSSPFFQNLFNKNQTDNPLLAQKTTYAQPYFLWKVDKRSKITPEFLLFERYEDKVIKHPNRNLFSKARLETESKGVLKKTSEGFFYLDISDEFIHLLFPYLLSEGAHKPFFPMGAHIPVISCEESEIYQILDKVKEVGSSFRFFLKDFVTIEPRSHHLEKVWAFLVECQDIVHLREKYHLTSKLCSQDFMIVIGAKPKEEKTLQNQDNGFFRINPAQLPA